MKTFKEFIHKYDIYASNDNYAIKLTNIIFMFIIFILMSICMFMIHPNDVKALNVPQPNSFDSYNRSGTRTGTYSIAARSNWWWSHTLYTPFNSTVGDIDFNLYNNPRLDFVWTNFKQYCNDYLTIEGSITHSGNFEAIYDTYDIYIINGGTSNLCSKSLDLGNHKVNFNCSTKMNNNAIAISLRYYGVNGLYGQIGLISTSQYSCVLDSSSIINNQNNNTQSIINNNNENANKITSAINDIHKDNEEAENTRKGILQSIIDLPKTLVNLFVDMLKGLFIPTDEQINDILDKSSDMAQNFGFIGQSVNFFIKLFTSLLSANQGSGCVILPELTLKFSESSLNMDDWTLWNERDVCFADHPWIGKTEIIDTIRTVTTLGLLILFLRFAVHEFDYILSKENSNSSASKEEGDD